MNPGIQLAAQQAIKTNYYQVYEVKQEGVETKEMHLETASSTEAEAKRKKK